MDNKAGADSLSLEMNGHSRAHSNVIRMEKEVKVDAQEPEKRDSGQPQEESAGSSSI